MLPFQLLSLALAILCPTTQASSSIRNPLGALSTLQNATIHTHNNRIGAWSEFDLTFNVRDDLQVKLSLEPNHDILAEDATISYLDSDGNLHSRGRVDRLQHKVFKGTAWVQRASIGQTKWQSVGWARAVVSQDGKQPLFEGAFSVHHDHHHIQTTTNYRRTRHPLDPEAEELIDGQEYLVMWRDSDILPSGAFERHQDLRRAPPSEPPSCQADFLSFNMQPDHPVYAGLPRSLDANFGVMDFTHIFTKRQIDSTTSGNQAGVNLTSTIGQTAGCPATRKVALVGVATDCTYTSAFNSTESVRENIISQMNTASAVWESTFNISLGLQNLTLSNAQCPATPASATEWNQACSGNVNIQDRLNYFSAWRGTQQDDNSHWTLLSTCNTGAAVGLAWLGQACVNTATTANTSSSTGNGAASGDGTETVTGANVVVRTQGASEWQIIAHETGHTYGAVHDCTSQTCGEPNIVSSQQCCPLSSSTCDAGQQYIMNPAAVQGVNHFSMCTIGNICSAIGRNSVKTTCLTDNLQIKTISGQECGNGIVEPGEDCDCGGPEGCGDDRCCDPNTCKFTSGSVCDDANESCCNNCQLASNGTVCRASTGVCDPQEVCSGSSGTCPPDVTAPDGQGCGSGLQCASGQCTSRDQQCKTVMGSYTQGNDTFACDSQGCTISCASPEFGSGVCYGLQQNFLDGTGCGGGGRCSNGQCKGSSVGGQVKSWIDDHKGIVIGICCAIGALILISILGCCLRRCRRRGRMPKQAPSPPPGGWQGWNGQAPPPAFDQRNAPPMGQRDGGGWIPPVMSGGRGGGWDIPPPPPPAHGMHSAGTVRYA